MKKILIGTHNKGKFKEISFLMSKKIIKISPIDMKIKSPKETGKTFSDNSILKVKYFWQGLRRPPFIFKFKIGQNKAIFNQIWKYRE